MTGGKKECSYIVSKKQKERKALASPERRHWTRDGSSWIGGRAGEKFGEGELSYISR